MVSISIIEGVGLPSRIGSTSMIDSDGLGGRGLCLGNLLNDRDCLTSMMLSSGLTGRIVIPAGSTGCLNGVGFLDRKVDFSEISILGGESGMSTLGGELVMSTTAAISFSGSETWLTVDTLELSLLLDTDGRVATARACVVVLKCWVNSEEVELKLQGTHLKGNH